MNRRLAIVFCLVFSGLTALVYQLIWTRLLGFAFGTTTEAVSTVLAVFFGGLALGNLLAARWLSRVVRPLRVYAWLELGIGVFALLSLPLLRELDAVWSVLGVPESGLVRGAVRIGLASLVLLPPTIAMGATLPVVARGLVTSDGTLGRWSAILYTANTFGAVLGAYLCGFWLIPNLGLASSVAVAGAVNLAVAGIVLLCAGDLRAAVEEAPTASPAAPPREAPALPGLPFLVFFGISGFVAIGYEIVWSKIFGIVMEGTLYGFATVLSAYLLGIGIGSLAISGRVDRIRDLPRAFGLLHVAIGATVALGMAVVPFLPYAYNQLGTLAPSGDAVHLLWLIVLPIVLVPTALFGAAFPILIRIYTRDARTVGQGMGIATAVNTAGSIAASLIVGFWWIPEIGTDATLYALLVLDFGVALVVLVHFQTDRGPRRVGSLAGSAAVVGMVALSFNGVKLDAAIAGRQLEPESFADYQQGLRDAARSRALTVEGKSSIVTVYAMPTARLLRTNGLPEAGFNYRPPHYPREAVSLGAWPYLAAGNPRRALVIGLGGGNTLTTLLRTPLESVDVVELERGVKDAVDLMHAGRENPLDDPRVRLRIDDGRNHLLLHALSEAPGYDLVTSQPSHPWRVGAANLFTEDFFRVAREALAEDGVFAAWLNGFRIDPESMLAVVTSFDRVFPGGLLVDIGGGGRDAFLLLGARGPVTLDPAVVAARLAEPELGALLAAQGVDDLPSLFAGIEGPTGAFAGLDPDRTNTDDNAFVETRIPRMLTWQSLDYDAIESRLPADAPVLPALAAPVDVPALGRALLDTRAGPTWPFARKLERLLTAHADAVDPVTAETLRSRAALRDPARHEAARETLASLADAHPSRPEPWRALGDDALARRDFQAAAVAFEAAHARSGAGADAFETGRALQAVDPERAATWFARIPEDERAHYPVLAVFAASRALDGGAEGAAIAAHHDAVRRYALTAEGRARPDIHALLAALATARGDAVRARAHQDADARRRRTLARPILGRAEAALERGDLDEAARRLSEAAKLVPSDEGVLAMRARLAHAAGDDAALDQALRALRAWAPSLEEGVAAENRFRTRHGLPLVSERPQATPPGA